MDVPNHKFDDMLVILDETFAHLKTQAPTFEAYDALTKKLNMIFHWVFEQLEEIKSYYVLALKARTSHAKGEVQKQVQWKPISDYALRDKSTGEGIMEVKTLEVNDDEDLVEDMIIGLQAIKEPPTKVILEAEKTKWYSVSWPSSLYETFQQSWDMA